MVATVTKYSVFIASPGDVSEERQAAIDVIRQWNDSHAGDARGIYLDAVTWEHRATPDFDEAPQDAINTQLLDQADLLIAILWSRVGTPTSAHEGGTLEEIARFQGRKMVYFCQRERKLSPGTEDASQAAQVDEFFHKCEKRFCSTYTEMQDFREQLTNHLTQWSTELPDAQTPQPPSELVSCDLLRETCTLIDDWDQASEDGTVLLYNVELTTFLDADLFERTWGNLGEQSRIRKVILLLPTYKLTRLQSFRESPQNRIPLDIFHVCPMKIGGVSSRAGDAPSNIGFAMFVTGDESAKPQPHPKAHIFFYAPPFSTADRNEASTYGTFWHYRYVLEMRGMEAAVNSLYRIWNEHYSAGDELPLPTFLQKTGDSTNSEINIEIDLDKPLFGPNLSSTFRQGRRIRERLFDPNVPTYVLDENYFLLDWNTTFEMIFPTKAFHRGDWANKFLKCLCNYDETLEEGRRAFRGQPPYFHDEPFIFRSDEYGEMRFTKVTSPVHGEDRKIMGWNVALNIDEVENRERFEEDRKACVKYDALLTRYARPYEQITRYFNEYQKLVDLHVASMKDATHVLDLGCGPGLLTEKLLESGKSVTAVDSNDAMLDRLLERCKNAIDMGRLQVVKANVEVLNGFKQEFDGAVMLNVFYAVNDKKACLNSLHRILRENARISISGPRQDAELKNLFAAVARTHATFADPITEQQWREDFEIFQEVNWEFDDLKILHCLSFEQLEQMLENAHFAVDNRMPDIYAGQGMLAEAHRVPV